MILYDSYDRSDPLAEALVSATRKHSYQDTDIERSYVHLIVGKQCDQLSAVHQSLLLFM